MIDPQEQHQDRPDLLTMIGFLLEMGCPQGLDSGLAQSGKNKEIGAVQQVLRPAAKRTAQPTVQRNCNLLRTVDDVRLHMPMENIAKDELALPPANQRVEGQCPCRPDHASIEERRARFKRSAHGGAIDLDEDVSRQIADTVHGHRPFGGWQGRESHALRNPVCWRPVRQMDGRLLECPDKPAIEIAIIIRLPECRSEPGQLVDRGYGQSALLDSRAKKRVFSDTQGGQFSQPLAKRPAYGPGNA